MLWLRIGVYLFRFSVGSDKLAYKLKVFIEKGVINIAIPINRYLGICDRSLSTKILEIFQYESVNRKAFAFIFTVIVLF